MNRLRPAGISAWSWVNSLGKNAYVEGSRAPTTLEVNWAQEGLASHVERLGIPGYSGAYSDKLPPLPARSSGHESRCARLLTECLSPLRDAVEGARLRWGAKRIAIVLGSSTGGIDATEAALAHQRKTGSFPPRYKFLDTHPYGALLELLVELTGIEGPALVVSTACSSGGKALASAQRLIHCGFADAVLAGGADALCEMTVRGFSGLGVLSESGCRPFDATRSGVSIGEGAALLLLERKSSSDFFLRAAGESSDAYHATSPDPEGKGARMAMESCLALAGLTPGDVDYLNAHGTGTEKNDSMESLALAEVFPAGVRFSSTKDKTGHQLGAAGATEAIFCLQALAENRIPPNRRPDKLDAHLRAQPVLAPVADEPVKVALSNSFAFGGSNVTLALSRGQGPSLSVEAQQTHSFTVRAGALWSPRFKDLAAYLSGEVSPSPDAPPAALLSARIRGRASLLTKIHAELFSQLLEGGDSGPSFDPAEIPTIYASRFGEMGTTLELLEQMKDDAQLSPMRFQASVHNTASGIISLATKNRAFSTALAASETTFAMALLEAQAWLSCHGGEILVLVADEELPASLTGSPTYASLGIGLLLSAELTSKRSLGSLGIVGRAPSHARPARPATTGANNKRLSGKSLFAAPATPGADLLEALVSGVSSTLALAPGWVVDVNPTD